MKKLIKNGRVAVLVSRGFGAGWSSWGSEHAEAMLFSPEIARLVLDKADQKDILEKAEDLFPGAYLGGVDGLEVEWVPIGTRFEISEYDGAEGIRIFGPAEGFVA